MSVRQTAGQILTARTMQIVSNTQGHSFTPPIAYTFGSSTYAVIGAGANFTFTKIDADTQLLVEMTASGAVSTPGGGTIVEFGLRFDSSTYDFTIMKAYLGTQYSRMPAAGSEILTGIPAGSRTVSYITKRTSGAATYAVDQYDRITVAITEVRE